MFICKLIGQLSFWELTHNLIANPAVKSYGEQLLMRTAQLMRMRVERPLILYGRLRSRAEHNTHAKVN